MTVQEGHDQCMLLARMLDRNPRTPYRIELALHNLHTTLYDRYVAWRLHECASTYSASVSPLPPNSFGKSFIFGKPSRIGSTVSP